MNEEQVKVILESKIASLTASANKGEKRQGLITGTTIMGACSPGKINFTYTTNKSHTWIAAFLKNHGFKRGRHDKRVIQGQKLRAFTKVVDEEKERKFNIEEYGKYKP